MKKTHSNGSGSLSVEDTQSRKLRLVGKPVASLEPYGNAARPMPAGGKAHMRKIEQWIKAKRLAEEVRRQEKALSLMPSSKGVAPPRKEFPLFLSITAAVAAIRRAFTDR
jgi:hypothetical protein